MGDSIPILHVKVAQLGGRFFHEGATFSRRRRIFHNGAHILALGDDFILSQRGQGHNLPGGGNGRDTPVESVYTHLSWGTCGPMASRIPTSIVRLSVSILAYATRLTGRRADGQA